MIYTKTDATVSECGKFRYELSRSWAVEGREVPGIDKDAFCVFVMLNPSTADGKQDDNTIRKCVAFADRWGFRNLAVVNLFAFRATEPRDMYKAADPVGPEQEFYYRYWMARASLVVAAWGANGLFMGRDQVVKKMFAERGFTMQHLGLTKEGQPKHPLYLKAGTQPQPWVTADERTEPRPATARGRRRARKVSGVAAQG